MLFPILNTKSRVDIEDFTSGSVSEWSKKWQTSSITGPTNVIAGDDKSLQWNGTAALPYTAVGWDNINVENCDVAMQFRRVADTAGGDPSLGMVICGSGGGASDYGAGYMLAIKKLSSPDELEIGRIDVTWGYSALASVNLSSDEVAGTWYWYRFKRQGLDLKAKVWADGGSEPVAWDIEVTDPLSNPYDTPIGSGWVGQMEANADVMQLDYVSVGYNGAPPIIP